MDNNFEDLFNNLNGKGGSDDFKKFIDKMLNFKDSFKINSENDMGEPTSVTRFEEDGYTYEKTEWVNEFGRMVKYEMINSPFETSGIKKELPLEKQLQLAVSEERYEDAAKIRDEIKKLKSETTVNHEDKWNF
jgi:excinuclease UvrABC helicase subunit UvrB